MVDTAVVDDKVVEKVEKLTLTSAIDAAVVTEDKKIEGADTTVDPDKKDDKVDDKKDDKSFGLSEDEQTQARQLFAALKDPDKAPIILEAIAKQGGYAKIETKKEAVEAKKDLKARLTEHLGEDLSVLAERLAPAIDSYIEEKLKESQTDIRATLAKREEEKLAEVALTSQKRLAQDFFKKDEIPEDILSDMNKMMDRITPTKDMSVGDYIESIFYSVVGKRGLTKGGIATEDRIKKNRTDAPVRLASAGVATRPGDTNGRDNSTKMSLTAAIDKAVAELEKEQG